MTDLPDYDAALRLALTGIDAITDTEMARVADAAGRVLAAPIVADRDLPSFNRAQLDGYALRASDLGRVESFPVVANIAAGQAPDVRVEPGRGWPLRMGLTSLMGVSWYRSHDPAAHDHSHGRSQAPTAILFR